MYTNDDLRNLSDEDKKRKRHSVEMEIVMLESENRKFAGEKINLDMDIRKLKIEEERTRITMEEKKKNLDRMNAQIIQNEDQIKRLKKEINFL